VTTWLAHEHSRSRWAVEEFLVSHRLASGVPATRNQLCMHEAKGSKGQARKEEGTKERGHDCELRMMMRIEDQTFCQSY
jgi:hypothetical protein